MIDQAAALEASSLVLSTPQLPDQGAGSPPDNGKFVLFPDYLGEPSPESLEPLPGPYQEPGQKPSDERRKPSWYERTHSYLERKLDAPAVWFDGFFGDPRYDEETPAGTFVKFTNTARWEKLDTLKILTGFKASYRLPKLRDKFRIVITGDSDEEAADLQGSSSAPALETAQKDRTADVSLRYELIRKLKATFDIGAGLRLKNPPQSFIRARYRLTRPLGEFTNFRFTETAYWWDNEGFKESSLIDLERSLSPATLLRHSHAVDYSETERGVRWTPSIDLLHQLSPKDALIADIRAVMATRPVPMWVDFRVVPIRYRRDLKDRWLFLELSPELSWTVQEGTRDREYSWAAIAMIEIRFDSSR